MLHDIQAAERGSERGLSPAEVLDRRGRFGLNTLPEKKGRSPLGIYISQFRNPLVYVISVAAVISVLLNEFEDAVIIAVVVFLDSILGFFQEYRAEKTVVALKQLLRQTARVIRDGNVVEIDASEIVPDDLVTVNPGDKIPADGVLIEAVSVSANEAILTGESEPVAKARSDQLYMGTTILSGRGVLKITSIGSQTELGKIASSLAEIKEDPTPLQVRLEDFSRFLTYVVIVLCVIILGVGILSGVGVLEMLRVSVILSIAAIPEGLLIAVTMILVIGMRAILRRKGLVKKLLAVETLGCVTTICTDKTGTLTEGNMRVVRTDFTSTERAAHVMALCNNLADSLEVTLWDNVRALGFDPQRLSEKYERIDEVPFSSESKYMLTTNKVNGNEVTHIKGAPEIVLQFCRPESPTRENTVAEIEQWANSGLKLIGLASKQNGSHREMSGFDWVGLVGIEDPVRPTARDAIALCHRAGINVKMVTGDYRGTAEKVAETLGLNPRGGRVIEGSELEAMTDDQLLEGVGRATVFCRVTPHHKFRIVEALRRRGEVTAMIGDGVNDAPALKRANIGVSVGTATDVARETAGIILLDNNFETLVNAVEEGRTVFENIRKVVAYVLSDSFAEMILIFGAIILGWPAPLTVAQLLWIHLICDGPLDIVLGFEKAETGIMDERPRGLRESILDNWGKLLIVTISSLTAISCLLIFQHYWQIHNDLVMGRTIVFTIIAIEDVVYAFSYRSLRQPVFLSGSFFDNKPFFGAVVLALGEQAFAIHVPFMNEALAVVPLSAWDWALALGFGFVMMGVVELVKYSQRVHRQRRERSARTCGLPNSQSEERPSSSFQAIAERPKWASLKHEEARLA